MRLERQYDHHANGQHPLDYFDVRREIKKGGTTTTFVYGPEHQRVRQSCSEGTTVMA